MDIYDDICHAFDRRTRSAKLTEGLTYQIKSAFRTREKLPHFLLLTSYLLLQKRLPISGAVL